MNTSLRRSIVLVVLCVMALCAQPASVPKTAVPVGPFFSAPGIDGVAVQLAVITSIQTQVGNQNATAAQVFTGACGNWTVANLHGRDIGLPLTAKPVAPLSQVVNTWQSATSTAANPSPVWVWMTDGPAVGSCPDLPPVPPTPPAGNVAIGEHLYGSYWRALPADTAADGTTVQATASDGTAGSWRKVVYPFGGWWLKQ